MSWISCQLGAREHYAVPRALHRKRALHYLLTDCWASKDSPFGRFYPRRLRERYHPELRMANVASFTSSYATFEVKARVHANDWQLIMERNRRFQKDVVRSLPQLVSSDCEVSVLFAYSYAALEILRFARARGWRTLLGQIDPGPAEERLVAKLYQRCAERGPIWSPAPTQYWESWRQECELADCVVVNSAWARQGLLNDGLSADKIHVVPLAYEPPPEATVFERTYPEHFTSTRPLRVLFLGQINLRKGVAEIFAAVDLLKNEPVEFWFVGPLQVVVPELGSRGRRSLRWVTNIPRAGVAGFYRDADVFLFPTHSDGFGLTQLEAQAWKLPLIASRNCGNVVTHGQNGLLLNEVSGEQIAQLLTLFLNEPERLVQLSKNAVDSEQFGLEQLGRRLELLS